MNLPDKYRTIALGTVIILIISLMVCIALVRNLSLVVETEVNAFMYILPGLSIVLVIFLYVLVMRLTGPEIKNHYISTYYNQKSQVAENQEDEKEEENVQQEEVTQEEFERNIFPQKKFKYLDSYTEKMLINMGKYLEISQGVFYMLDKEVNKYKLTAGYATTTQKDTEEVEPGVGLTGQAVLDKKISVIDDVPDDYIQIESGLGQGRPAQLIILPVMKDQEVIAIFELASLKKFDNHILDLLSGLSDKLGSQLENYEMR